MSIVFSDDATKNLSKKIIYYGFSNTQADFENSMEKLKEKALSANPAYFVSMSICPNLNKPDKSKNEEDTKISNAIICVSQYDDSDLKKLFENPDS